MTQPKAKPCVSIHYCPGCKWLPRSTWMAQEVLETFSADIESVSLYPSEDSGAFQILVDGAPVWDRRIDGGFPQPKELKKRIRDIIQPGKDLGHIDKN